MDQSRPSDKGIEKYPPDGFAVVESGSLACTCADSCTNECWGECGCKACERVTLDYLRSGIASDEEIEKFRSLGGSLNPDPV